MSDDLDNDSNYEAFRDGVFTCLVALTVTSGTGRSKTTSKRRQTNTSKTHSQSAVSPQETKRNEDNVVVLVDRPSTTATTMNDPSELAEFSDYIATELFPSLPKDLRTLTHKSTQEDHDLAERWSLPLSRTMIEETADQVPPTITDNLSTYGIIEPPRTDIESFISPVITTYISTVTTAPSTKWIETRLSACEICERDWVPITYHHLIPKGVHAKVLKRGWHEEAMLNSVAWLCRACHTFVHKMASNEELAREWYTVDLICSREDTMKWAQWVGRVRWKKT